AGPTGQRDKPGPAGRSRRSRPAPETCRAVPAVTPVLAAPAAGWRPVLITAEGGTAPCGGATTGVKIIRGCRCHQVQPDVNGSIRPGPASCGGAPGRPEATACGPRAAPRRRGQSLDSLADGVTMRCTQEPKSMSRAVPSSTPVMVPRPYLSWVTLSP